MKNKFLLFIFILGFSYQINLWASHRKYIGLFMRSDPRVEGIKYVGWGSRPYEYAWARSVVSVKNKCVIDLGIGLPSKHNWYRYVIENLQPSFYAGIDCRPEIKKQLCSDSNYEIRCMNMTRLKYPDKSFDVAYCISTFEHLTYEEFVAAVKETYRVLKDDGLLVVTLDEEWINTPTNPNNNWNFLEQDLIKKGLFCRKERSFGLPEFAHLIEDHFTFYQEDAIIDRDLGIIRSKENQCVYYQRSNWDEKFLSSRNRINSCVSYALFKKK